MSLYVPVIRTPFFLAGAFIIIVLFWGFALVLLPFSLVYIIWGGLMLVTTLNLDFFDYYDPMFVSVFKKSFEVLRDLYYWWMWMH